MSRMPVFPRFIRLYRLTGVAGCPSCSVHTDAEKRERVKYKEHSEAARRDATRAKATAIRKKRQTIKRRAAAAAAPAAAAAASASSSSKASSSKAVRKPCGASGGTSRSSRDKKSHSSGDKKGNPLGTRATTGACLIMRAWQWRANGAIGRGRGVDRRQTRGPARVPAVGRAVAVGRDPAVAGRLPHLGRTRLSAGRRSGARVHTANSRMGFLLSHDIVWNARMSTAIAMNGKR